MLITKPKRKPKRVRVLIDGTLEGAEGTLAVRVRDISEGGALIETTDTPKTGDKVRLSCRGHDLAGKVLWQRGAWAGIRFERPLQNAIWNEFAAMGLRVGAPRNYRPDLIPEDEEPIEVSRRTIRIRRTASGR
jgi:hypothetical protein